jgi:hypothetical protein
LRTRAFGQQLPWHQIAVMLHHGQKNHVSVANKFSSPRLRHEIDAFGRSAGKNDLVRIRCADVFGHTPPRIFVSFRRTRTQSVQTAMDIGVVVLVEILNRLDHRSRLL